MEPMLWSGRPGPQQFHLPPFSVLAQAGHTLHSERQGERVLRHTVAGDVGLRQWTSSATAILPGADVEHWAPERAHRPDWNAHSHWMLRVSTCW
jgi:hypothetical protein